MRRTLLVLLPVCVLIAILTAIYVAMFKGSGWTVQFFQVGAAHNDWNYSTKGNPLDNSARVSNEAKSHESSSIMSLYFECEGEKETIEFIHFGSDDETKYLLQESVEKKIGVKEIFEYSLPIRWDLEKPTFLKVNISVKGDLEVLNRHAFMEEIRAHSILSINYGVRTRKSFTFLLEGATPSIETARLDCKYGDSPAPK